MTPNTSDCDNTSVEDNAPRQFYKTTFENRLLSAQPQEPPFYQQQQQPLSAFSQSLAPVQKFISQHPLQDAYTSTFGSTPTSPQVSSYLLAPRGNADRILDEAVDELFLSQPENEQIMDFVNSWNPAAFGADAALTNDEQLGNLLDRLLDD